MKKRIIIGIVFAVVFIAALLTFSSILNRGTEDAAVDMGGVSLPLLSFEEGSYTINELPGYAEAMEITAMRDLLFPVSVGTSVKADISGYSGKIHSAAYEVSTLDGKKALKKKTIKNVKDSINIELGNAIADGGEKVLKIKLSLDDDRNAYYYMRIVRAAEFNVQQCLKFAEDFHNKTFHKEEVNTLRQHLLQEEPKDTSLQTVTLKSDIEQIGWGNLKPEIEGKVRWQIKESNETYTSIYLKYQVKSKNNLYNVTEFLKVRFLKGKASLEDYERTMNQVFSGAKKDFDRKGILIGIADEDVPYLVSESGDVISFVQERELWCYNKKENEISLVFSFADAENKDIRNYNDSHNVRLVDMDKQGNITFAVYGYMNRGVHEGQVGTAVYYFDIGKNYVEEKAFISSKKSGEMALQETDQLICYNDEQNILFMMFNGVLYEIDLEKRETKTLVENLTEEQYSASEDGEYLAYQSNGTLTEANAMTVWNLKSGKSYQIEAADDEFIRPLGFMSGDVVYGVGRKADIGKSVSREKVLPLYKLEIRNEENKVVKTYQMEQKYVTDILVENNMVTLNRVEKSGKVYVNISQDYITNNKEQEASTVQVETYLPEGSDYAQVRLTDENRIENTSPKLLKIKHRMSEEAVTLGFAQTVGNPGYYVYGRGKLQGIYEKAGTAIQAADAVRGVVVTSSQTKIWERGNRMLRYSLEGAKAFVAKSGENSLAASIRKMLSYEGKSVDVAGEMAKGKSALDIINEYSGGEALDLTGCTVEELCYIIGKGTPVVAMTGKNSAILLVGYDDTMITYLNPVTGRKPTELISVIEKKAEESQSTFIGYVK